MSEGDGAADTMRGRVGENRIKFWLLLGANRLVLTILLAALFFGCFMLGATAEPALSDLLEDRAVIESIFSAMLGALITGVMLVVTIGQLIISQENGPLGDQHQRMRKSMDVRTYVREVIGQPAPADPASFLQALLDESDRRARALLSSIAATDDRALRDDVDELVDGVTDNATSVSRQLEGAEFGSFDVVFAALNFNYSAKIYRIERIEHEYEAVLDEAQSEALSDLRTSLTMFGPVREHVKTLYFQWELIDLSRLILYVTVPALLVAGMMLAFVDSGTVTGTSFGAEHLVWLVGAAFTVTLLPFLLLTVYVLRIVTTAKRTLAIGPVVLRDARG